jgi:hypothetical protein
MHRTLALVIVLSLVGCGKSDKGEGSKGGGDGKGAAKPAAAAATALGKVPLKADLPAGAEVGDGIGGGVMVQAPGLVFSVNEEGEMDAKTLDDEKKNAEMYTPKNIQTETLSDGWVLTFENEGGAGKNYWVTVHREIGGKKYRCSTTATLPEQQANAVKACKSLKP